MAHRRNVSSLSTDSPPASRQQELSSMYDYLAKIVLLGPSSCGKSCLLHRFVKDEWRVLTSQTIGVEFASKIVKLGSGSRRKRIKLQLWDTAGTERFRSVSRSYYRGAAGAVLVYDVANKASFTALPTFLQDAKALASPYLTVVLAGNKSDLTDEYQGAKVDDDEGLVDAPIPESVNASSQSQSQQASETASPGGGSGFGAKKTKTVAPEGRDVSIQEASVWASAQGIKTVVEVSALSGDGVEDIFVKLARTILTRIELGEIDPSDPQSGIQYGDYNDSTAYNDSWAASDNGSIRSNYSSAQSPSHQASSSDNRRRRRKNSWMNIGGMREWEGVFRLDGGRGRGRRGGGGRCC